MDKNVPPLITNLIPRPLHNIAVRMLEFSLIK